MGCRNPYYEKMNYCRARVVLHIEPFMLSSAIQLLLAQNPQLEVVLGELDMELEDDATRLGSDRTVDVELREGSLQFEVNAGRPSRTCFHGIEGLAEYLAAFASNGTPSRLNGKRNRSAAIVDLDT